jgi:hypothetical protein
MHRLSKHPPREEMRTATWYTVDRWPSKDTQLNMSPSDVSCFIWAVASEYCAQLGYSLFFSLRPRPLTTCCAKKQDPAVPALASQTEKMASSHISTISPEILELVLIKLTIEDLLRCMRVCRALQSLSKIHLGFRSPFPCNR